LSRCKDKLDHRNEIPPRKQPKPDFTDVVELSTLLSALALPREVPEAFCVNHLHRLQILIGIKRCLGVFGALTDAVHGKFSQAPGKRLQGNGCQQCAIELNLGEDEVAKILGSLGVSFERQFAPDWGKSYGQKRYSVIYDFTGKQETMTTIPVYVQPPNEPDKARLIGEAGPTP
jgi:hypothetical protein